MTKNSDLFFVEAKAYQDARNTLEDDFRKRLQSMERYYGSKGYEQEKEALITSYENELKSLQNEARSKLSSIIENMKRSAYSFPVKAPTNEQVNMINLLRMKKDVTRKDLEHAVEVVKDIPLALSIIDEIAHDNDIIGYGNHIPAAYDSQSTLNQISIMEDSVNDFVEHNSSRASRAVSRYYGIRNGEESPLRRRKTFESKLDCFNMFTSVGADSLNSFFEVIDYID